MSLELDSVPDRRQVRVAENSMISVHLIGGRRCGPLSLEREHSSRVRTDIGATLALAQRHPMQPTIEIPAAFTLCASCH